MAKINYNDSAVFRYADPMPIRPPVGFFADEVHAALKCRMIADFTTALPIQLSVS
jgi:hypothetical protein